MSVDPYVRASTKTAGDRYIEEHNQTGQPKPNTNTHPAVWDLVMVDIKARDEFGAKKYGVRLQPHNGRDVLRDAYEEALDLVVYLRQAIYERDNPTSGLQE